MKWLCTFAAVTMLGLTACQSPKSPTTSVPSASKASDGVLRIAVEGNFPPFSFTDSSGKLAGFDVDMGNELCRRLQRKCDIMQIPFDAFIAGLQAGRYDAIVSSMDITEARQAYISFSDPYYRIPVYLAGRKGLPVAVSGDGTVTPASLAGLRIAVQQSTRAEDFVRRMFPSATILPQNISGGIASAVSRGDADLIFEDRLMLHYEISNELGSVYQLYGAGYIDDELVPGAGVAVRKDDAKLRDDINIALKQIRGDGTFQQITARYFQFPIFAE